MSDAADYFRSYAAKAICKARNMPFGRLKRLQRSVGRIYHLLTKEAAFAPNVQYLDDFRVAQTLEKQVNDSQQCTNGRQAALPRNGSGQFNFCDPIQGLDGQR